MERIRRRRPERQRPLRSCPAPRARTCRPAGGTSADAAAAARPWPGPRPGGARPEGGETSRRAACPSRSGWHARRHRPPSAGSSCCRSSTTHPRPRARTDPAPPLPRGTRPQAAVSLTSTTRCLWHQTASRHGCRRPECSGLGSPAPPAWVGLAAQGNNLVVCPLVRKWVGAGPAHFIASGACPRLMDDSYGSIPPPVHDPTGPPRPAAPPGSQP